MIEINTDSIIIENDENTHIELVPLEGPYDPLELRVRITGEDFDLKGKITIARDELEELQASIINFMNTGYFDQEG